MTVANVYNVCTGAHIQSAVTGSLSRIAVILLPVVFAGEHLSVQFLPIK